MEKTKENIEEKYKMAVNEYVNARNADQRCTARKKIAELEETACELYGSDFSDHLNSKYKPIIDKE